MCLGVERARERANERDRERERERPYESRDVALNTSPESTDFSAMGDGSKAFLLNLPFSLVYVFYVTRMVIPSKRGKGKAKLTFFTH